MEVRFGDADLERLETDSSFNAGRSRGLVRAFRRLMQIIRDAPDEREFRALKSLHLEKLKGSRVGEHSMRLNNQFRLVLKFEGKAANKIAIICSIEDYH